MGLSTQLVGMALLACVCGCVPAPAHPLQAVGPCVVDPDKASFHCGHRRLKMIPEEIWPNVTKLDLSLNKLRLTHPTNLKALQHFQQLTHLNLSANYLPLLAKGSLNLPALEVLDLSRCRLTKIEAEAFEDLPKLQRVFLKHNWLQSSMASTLKACKGVLCVHDPHEVSQFNVAPEEPRGIWGRARQISSKGYLTYGQGRSDEGVEEIASAKRSLRRLMVETHDVLGGVTTSNISVNGTASPPRVPAHNWRFLVGVLVTAIVLSITVAVVAKCKLFHRYLTSYRHSRFSNIDSVSQCESDGYDVGYAPRGGTTATSHRAAADDDEEEGGGEDYDDGFIEDNYIQPGERDRASRAAEHHVKEEEDVESELDEDMFTIG